MGKHAQAPKSKHLKELEHEDVKLYVPKGQFSDEQSAELPPERNRKKRLKAVHEREFSKSKIWLVAVASLLFAAAWILPSEGWIRIAIFFIPYILVAVDVYFDAGAAVLDGDFLCRDIFVAAASLVAMLAGRAPDGVIMMVLYRASDLLEAYSRLKSQKATAAILEVQPYGVNLETEDGLINVLPEDIRVDDIISVEQGEYVPLDGVIIEGMTSVSTAALTGSGKPIALREGMRIISGCVNLSKTIKVRVSSNYEDSTSAKILRLVDDARENISKQEAHLLAADKIYKPIMLIVAVLISVIPPIFNGAWGAWVGRGIVLAIAANLSSLIVSVPIAYAGAINNGYYRGILFKGAKYVEALAKSEAMAFNKTGTLTDGRYVISDVVPKNMTQHELLTLAATAEMFSDHPIARALRDACGMLDPLDYEVTQTQEMPGRGVSAFVNGKLVYVGNAYLLEEHSLAFDAPKRAGTAVHVSLDGRYCGHIIMNDKVKDGAFDALEALRVQGVKNMVMLTGDLRSQAKTTASSLNFDMVKAELMPDNKVSAVEYLMATLADDAMFACVGNAVDDAAMLKRANVGIALGALAQNEALDTADIVIMASDLKKIPAAFKIAKRSFSISKTNIYIGVAAKAAIILVGALGLLPIWAAAFLDAITSAAMLINSLRTLKSGDI